MTRDPLSSASIRSAEVKRLAVFLPSLAGGGVARSMLLLCKGFVERGHEVDLVLCETTGPYLDRVPDGVRVKGLAPAPLWRARLRALSVDAGAFGRLLRPILLPIKPARVLRYLPDLTRYLEQEQPDALFASKTHANLLACWARRLAGVDTRVVVIEHNNLSRQTQGPRGRKWRWRYVAPLIRRVYPTADTIVAVSDGVADDLARKSGVARETITTVLNPVVDPDLLEQATAPLEHPWFAAGAAPVLLGIGRISAQKDFPTLIRAFARVRHERPARLIILGEGKKAEQREELLALARELGVERDLQMPGFASNPFAYLSRASAFVLSSCWEGLPTVLIEALACGCPVVSTDCPSGPHEILRGGEFGPLTPVRDPESLARAVLEVLDAPPDPQRLRDRGAEFSVAAATDGYLNLLPN